MTLKNNCRLVSGSWDNGIRLFERESGRCVAQSDQLHNGPISKVQNNISGECLFATIPDDVRFTTGDPQRGKILDTFVVKGFSSEEIGHHNV